MIPKHMRVMVAEYGDGTRRLFFGAGNNEHEAENNIADQASRYVTKVNRVLRYRFATYAEYESTVRRAA